MTIIVISIVAAWILFSTALVTIICINGSHCSKDCGDDIP
jgi:hypothetical protein